MASWVCGQDRTVFTVGASCCPSCQARDAFEQGGDEDLNVYDAVAVTGIASPGDAWGLVNAAVAEAQHQSRREGLATVTADEGRALVMANEQGGDGLPALEDDPVAQRLGLVPGDPGAADSSTDPEPVDTPDDVDKSTSEVGQDDVSS